MVLGALEPTEVSAVPSLMVGAKTSVEETPVAVHGTATLAQRKSNSFLSVCDFGVPGNCNQGSTAAGQWILSCALVRVFFRKLFQQAEHDTALRSWWFEL